MGCTTSSLRNDVPIKDRGVRLEVVRKVLNELTNVHYTTAKRKLGREPSPGEVIVHGYVKEEADGESLAVHLMHDPVGAELVGSCNVFVSHTWGTRFADTVAALEEYESHLPEDSPPAYYFIDFFAINQFCPSGDLEELGELAKSCGTLVLVAKPWRRPAALERAWCIFEIAHGILGGAELVLVMSPGEKRLLKAEIENLYSSEDATRLLEVFANIDTSKMKATVENDLKMIRDFMEENMGGFNRVDQLVSSSLRKWVGNMTKAFCESFSPKGGREHANFLIDAGKLFAAIGDIGMWEYKLKASQQARKISERLHLEDFLGVSMNDEAISLEVLGRFDEAVVLHKKLIRINMEKHGKIHESTLSGQYNLGFLYVKIQKWNEAEKELTDVLKGFKELHGPMSYAVGNAQLMLAQVLRDSGKDIKRAELLFKDILDHGTKAFGSSFVLATKVNHARCLDLQGEHGRALATYTKALPPLIKAVGDESSVVKALQAWIAESHEDQEGKTDL